MNTPSNQIFADIDFLVDTMGMDADECDEILRACEDLGGISAEYFCEEFVFITEDPDDIPRLQIAFYNYIYETIC